MRLFSLQGAALLSVLLAGAAFSPLTQAAPPAVPAATVTPAPASSVAINKDGQLRVQISSQQQTTLSSELAAKISRLPFKEGDAFKAGQTLVAFDCSLFQAQLSKAQAQLDAARQTLKVNRRLAELNSISSLEVEQAEAKVKETEAETSAMRVTVGKCNLPAPFSGRVAKLQVEQHQYLTQGRPILDIVDTQHLEVKLIVPSKWLAWLSKGTRFAVHVDELNKDCSAKVVRTGARIDPVTQSVSLVAEIEGSPAELLPGMSGWASFKVPK